MPLTASEFIQRIESHLCEFGIDTDSNKESIDFSESFYIKAFDIGGMSGGQVSISWWRAEGMPLIKERLSGIEFEGTSFDGRPETVASSHPTNIGVKSKAIFNDFTNKPKTKDWFSVRPHMVYLFEHVFNQLCAIYNPDKLSTQFIRSQNKHLPHLLFNLNAKTQEIADNPDSEFGNAIWIKPRYNSRKPTDQYIIHVEIAITFKEHQHHFISFHKGMKGLIEAIQRHKFKNFVFTDKVEGKEFVEVMTDNIASDHLELITQLNKVLSDSFSRFPRRQNDYRRLIHEMEKKHNITGVKSTKKPMINLMDCGWTKEWISFLIRAISHLPTKVW
ncbi:hypothetical protein [Photobacterium profundum]|uniref:hypothetical protein n=1 Tax=Photobacterium profundum TaxID=74109 RepID=UPI003D0CDFC9